MSLKSDISSLFSLDELKDLFTSDEVQSYLRAKATGAKSIALKRVFDQIPAKLHPYLTKAQLTKLAQTIGKPEAEPVAIRVKVDEQSGDGIGAILAKVASTIASKVPMLAKTALASMPAWAKVAGKELGKGAVFALGGQAVSNLMGGELEELSIEAGPSRKMKADYIHSGLALTGAQLASMGISSRNDHDSFTVGLDADAVRDTLAQENIVIVPMTQTQINRIAKAGVLGKGVRLSFSRAQLRAMKNQFQLQEGSGVFSDIMGGQYELPLDSIRKVLSRVDGASKKTKRVLDALEAKES